MQKNRNEPQQNQQDNNKDQVTLPKSKNNVAASVSGDQTGSTAKQPTVASDSWLEMVYKVLDEENRGHIFAFEILDHIKFAGVSQHHQIQTLIQVLKSKDTYEPIYFEEFKYLINSQSFIKKVIENQLVIPQFSHFQKNFENCFNEIKADIDGKYSAGEVASYIPSLFKANPKWFATAFCSIDGQFSQLGDYNGKFSMQSVSKVVAYAYLYHLYV